MPLLIGFQLVARPGIFVSFKSTSMSVSCRLCVISAAPPPRMPEGRSGPGSGDIATVTLPAAGLLSGFDATAGAVVAPAAGLAASAGLAGAAAAGAVVAAG